MSLARVSLFFTAGLCAAQDPLQVLPHNYSVAFDNEFVRVVRVHYGPHERLPVHDHPKTPTVYVYLADAGPVKFTHTGADPFTLERPAVKAGGFRLNRGFIETHEVESLADQSNEFLRVELKKLKLGTAGLTGRFPPKESSSGAKVEFEDSHLRILRVTCQPQTTCEDRRSSEPALVIDFSGPSSPVRWDPANSVNPIDNHAKPYHALRIEFNASS